MMILLLNWEGRSTSTMCSRLIYFRLKYFISCYSQGSRFEDFKEAVGKFGKVTDYFYNSCRKHAFIEFSTSEEALACVAALNKTEVAGQTIKMKIETNKKKYKRKKKKK